MYPLHKPVHPPNVITCFPLSHSRMHQYVIYNSQYQIIICRQHGYAIQSRNVIRHFREHHKTISWEIRQRIAEYVHGLITCQLERLETPDDGGEPIHGLTIIKGCQCVYEGCTEKGALTSIKRHCQGAHKWTEGDNAMWTNQAMQTFRQGPHRK